VSDVTIYHNSRCSKSRETLALLEAREIEITVIDYLKEAPTVSELRELHRKLGEDAGSLVRTNEADYACSGLNEDSTDEAIYRAIEKFPKLLQRPIIIRGERAVIGRPSEKVYELF
jgi:arsenate reductase (glutaredoxin)